MIWLTLYSHYLTAKCTVQHINIPTWYSYIWWDVWKCVNNTRNIKGQGWIAKAVYNLKALSLHFVSTICQECICKGLVCDTAGEVHTLHIHEEIMWCNDWLVFTWQRFGVSPGSRAVNHCSYLCEPRAVSFVTVSVPSSAKHEKGRRFCGHLCRWMSLPALNAKPNRNKNYHCSCAVEIFGQLDRLP